MMSTGELNEIAGCQIFRQLYFCAFCRPLLCHQRNTTPLPIYADILRRAEQLIDSCEKCAPDIAEIPLDYVLDSITGSDPEFTDYVLTEPARCPRCLGAIQTGYWRWHDSEHDGRKVFILPGTLVTLK
jgi:hypothetical protein